MARALNVALLAALACVLLQSSAAATRSLVNEKVVRTIGLKTQIVLIDYEIHLRNDGDSTEGSFDFVIPPSQAERVAEVRALQSGSSLVVSEPKQTDKGAKYTVTLKSGIPKGEKKIISVLTSHIHMLTPFPAEISQTERQFVVFVSNLHFYSPYQTESSKTEIVLQPGSTIESYTPSDSLTVGGSQLSYGPDRKIAPYSDTELRVHFENNHPFVTVTSLVREVEVSHWGHCSFEEHVDLTHTGAKLKGGFSRLDFQRNPGASPSHFRLLKARLPASAHSAYYRDVIGNISTSRFHVEKPSDEEPFALLELLPRYLLFGGWKTAFYYGYVVPLSEVLGVANDGTYNLHVPLGTAIDGVAVESLTTRFILPEGATDISVKTTALGISEERSIRKTYLDIGGRPVITLTKRNAILDNESEVVVTYRFPLGSHYRELAMLIAGFFSVFMLIVFVGRFRLTIGDGGAAAASSKKGN